MANERQTDLILRAHVDQALAPLAQVTQRVKDLITVLDQQRLAAQTGDTTLGEYAKALRDVEKASGDLLKQRAALDNFATRGQKVDTQQSVVDQRQQRRDQFATALPTDPTNAQTAALARLDKALASSQTRLETATIAYTKAADQLQRFGVITDEMTSREARLAALDPAHDLISGYVLLATEALKAGQAQNDTLLITLRAANLEKQTAAQREKDTARFLADQEAERRAVLDVAEATRAKGAAAQRAVDTGTARNIRQADVEAAFAADDAEKKLAAQRAADDAKAVSDTERKARTIAQVNAGLAASLSEDQTRLAVQTEANAAKAVEIEERKARTIAQFNANTAASIAADQDRLAAQFIADAAKAVEANDRKTELIGRANAKLTTLIAEQNTARARLDAASAAAAASQATRVAGTGAAPLATPPGAVAQVGAVTGITRDGSAAITDTASAVAKLDAAMGTGTLTAQTYNRRMGEVFALQRQIASDAGLVDSYQKQTVALMEAVRANQAAETEVSRLIALLRAEEGSLAELARAEKAAEVTSANLQRQTAQQAGIDAQLKARKIDTTALDVETNKLVGTMQRLSAVQARVQQGSGTVFGLSSYQLQNLSFQVNDVITQLSLGQGVLRTVESQAGQIFQVFETSITAMRNLLLVAIPAAAAIGLVALSLSRVADTDAAQRRFSASLAGTVDGASRSAAGLTTLQRQMERMGVSFDDAGIAIKTFLDEGLDSKRIEQFTNAARNLSQGLGVDFKDAVKELATIPAGSIEDLEKFLLKYDALTPVLQAYIEEQRKGGSIDLARAATIDALSIRFKAARDEGVGPLKDGFVSLTNAFHDLEDAIGTESALQDLIRDAKTVIELITSLTGLVKQFGGVIESAIGTEAFKGLADAIKAAIDPIGHLLDSYRKIFNDKGTSATSEGFNRADLAVDALDAKLKLAQRTYDDFKSKLAQGGDQDNPLLSRFAAQIERIKTELDAAVVKRDALVKGSPVATGGPEGGPTTVPGISPNGFGPGGRGNIPAASASQIDEVAKAMGLPQAVADFATRIAQVESGGNQLGRNPQNDPNAISRSATNALGMLQVEPDSYFNKDGSPTKRTVGGTAYDLTDPIQNIKAGLALLAELFKQFGEDQRKVAIGYNAGPGKAGLTDAQLPGETSGYLAKLGLTAGSNFQPPTSGLANPNQTGLAQSRNQLEQIHLQQQIDALVNAALLGNSQARIDQDNRLAELEKTRVQKEADGIRGSAVENDASIALRGKLDTDYRAKQKAQRDKEDAEVKQRADSASRALDDAVANADPTNADAKRKAAANKAQAGFDTLETLIAQGVQALPDGTTIAQYRAKLVALRDQAISIATVEADTAIIDAAVKERDAKLATIKASLDQGTLTMAEAFTQTTRVIAESGPKIKAAIAKSNADLAGQPQTPRVAERLAQNARINPDDPVAFKSTDDAAMKQILDTQKSRNDLVASYNELVKVGAITQDDAEVKIAAAYAKTTPLLLKQTQQFQTQLNDQYALGVISEETYNRMSAGLQKVQADTNHLTKLEQLLSDGIAQSFASNAIQAFNTIADATGKAIAGTGKWSDVLASVGQAFGQFAAGVLKDIAGILIKYELLILLKSALGVGPGGGAGAAHTGGIAGALTQSHSGLNPLLWVGAPRAHGGGLAGLAYGEVPVIVQAGEEIVTAKDPRHRNNYNPNAGANAQPSSIRNVMLFDPSEVAASMAGQPGEKVTLTHIKRNAPAIRQLLGVN